MLEWIEVRLKDGSRWLIPTKNNYWEEEADRERIKYIILKKYKPEDIPITIKNVDDFIYDMKDITPNAFIDKWTK